MGKGGSNFGRFSNYFFVWSNDSVEPGGALVKLPLFDKRVELLDFLRVDFGGGNSEGRRPRS